MPRPQFSSAVRAEFADLAVGYCAPTGVLALAFESYRRLTRADRQRVREAMETGDEARVEDYINTLHERMKEVR